MNYCVLLVYIHEVAFDFCRVPQYYLVVASTRLQLVNVAESERPATPPPPFAALLLVGEGGPFWEVSITGGRKYAARSAGVIPAARGSSDSDASGSLLNADVGAGGGRCAITSAGGSWCPHHG